MVLKFTYFSYFSEIFQFKKKIVIKVTFLEYYLGRNAIIEKYLNFQLGGFF